MEKYRRLRQILIEEKILLPQELYPAPLASKEQIILAHDETYFEQIENGTIDPKIMREIGFPWSERIILRSRASVGGFLAACQEALKTGLSGNLSGGTHHAHRDRGEGFCVFNDFAVACLYLKQEKKAKNILILDLDVHQGNGNSSILKGTDGITICSIHGKNNYPFRKVASDIDVELEDDCGDEEYLKQLDILLQKIKSSQFDLIMYQAGVDPLATDKFGKLALTHHGLAERDQKVFHFALKMKCPIVLAMGGGYADPIEDSLKAHTQTYKIAKSLENSFASLLA
ncbi:MAG: histone deacetylase [Bdellovibrio sp.]